MYLCALLFVYFLTAARAAPAENPYVNSGFNQPYLSNSNSGLNQQYVPVTPPSGVVPPVQPIINLAFNDVFVNSNDWVTDPTTPLPLSGIGNDASFGTGSDTVKLLSEFPSCSPGSTTQALGSTLIANCENGCQICEKGSNSICATVDLCPKTSLGQRYWQLCTRDTQVCYDIDVNNVPGASDAISHRKTDSK